ncbi:MAG: DUF4402 domain-containing protein [bacterium]
MIGLTTKKPLFTFFLCGVLFFYFDASFAQPQLPQRTLTLTPTQSLNFGTLSVTGSSGGTVTVGYDGSRTSTGNIALLSILPHPQVAIFEIKICQGRNVIISFSPSITLTGSYGDQMTLDLGPTDRGPNGVSFMANADCNFVSILRIGGTLHVPGTAHEGTYSGSFNLTLNQE